MTTLRNNRLFYALMIIAFITAFFVPHRISDRGRAHVQALFAPVAVPARWVAAVIHDRIWSDRGRDDASPASPRPTDAVYAENERLRVELASLSGQLEYYRVQAGEREKLGALRDRCAAFTVMGPDSGTRDALNLVGATAGALRRGMPALTSAGLIGQVERVGTGSALVLLLTDRQSVFTGKFGRPATDDNSTPTFALLALEPTLIAGIGQSQMKSDKLAWKDVQAVGLRVGDWVVLDDPAWPAALKWSRVGKVRSIQQSKKNMLFAEIIIDPVVNPQQLREVLVMDR